MPSISFQRLNPRERRVVLGGAAVSAAVLIVMLGVLPFVERWGQRESVIGARMEQLARLESLLGSEDTIRKTLEEREQAQAPLQARLLTGATPAVAASALQALVQGYADQSQVTLDRVDVVADPKPGKSGLPEIPVQLAGESDIYGLTDMLSLLQRGEKLLAIDEVRVSNGVGIGERADLLSWSIRLHGPYLSE